MSEARQFVLLNDTFVLHFEYIAVFLTFAKQICSPPFFLVIGGLYHVSLLLFGKDRRTILPSLLEEKLVQM